METSEIKLTDEEMVLLDGKVRKEIQQAVNDAKERLVRKDLPEKVLRFFQAVRSAALKDLVLDYRHTRVRSCDFCSKEYGYYKFGRGQRKGEANHSAPIYYPGVDLKHSFVIMNGYAALGCCTDCMQQFAHGLVDFLGDIKAEIPQALSGKLPEWRLVDVNKCLSCGWEGPESDMGWMPAVFSGHYRGKCPKCAAAKLPLARNIFKTVGKTVLPRVQVEIQPNRFLRPGEKEVTTA